MRTVLRIASLATALPAVSLLLASCQTNRGGSATDGYTPPPTLSPVEATDRMQNKFRQWR